MRFVADKTGVTLAAWFVWMGVAAPGAPQVTLASMGGGMVGYKMGGLHTGASPVIRPTLPLRSLWRRSLWLRSLPRKLQSLRSLRRKLL